MGKISRVLWRRIGMVIKRGLGFSLNWTTLCVHKRGHVVIVTSNDKEAAYTLGQATFTMPLLTEYNSVF